MHNTKSLIHKIRRPLRILCTPIVIGMVLLAFSASASAEPVGPVANGPSNVQYCSDGSVAPNDDATQCFQNVPHCGGGSEATKMSFDIGCKGEGNPIPDALFAIIRFLSDGVGLVIIASMIVAGIQYTSSRGDPQSTAKAVHRIQSNFTALLIFIFGYAILNYLIPSAVLH